MLAALSIDEDQYDTALVALSQYRTIEIVTIERSPYIPYNGDRYDNVLVALAIRYDVNQYDTVLACRVFIFSTPGVGVVSIVDLIRRYQRKLLPPLIAAGAGRFDAVAAGGGDDTGGRFAA